MERMHSGDAGAFIALSIDIAFFIFAQTGNIFEHANAKPE
jgi:hypothetical protein